MKANRYNNLSLMQKISHKGREEQEQAFLFNGLYNKNPLTKHTISQYNFINNKQKKINTLHEMKTQKQIICENVETYGFVSQSDNDLLKLINYKEDATSFYNSIQYKAFKELTRRKETEKAIKISNSQQIQHEMSFLEGYAHEEFWAIYLKRNNTIIKKTQHSKGGISGTVVDVRLILKEAILSKASAIILCHNHPSGELRPSEADKQMTSKIKQSAQIMDIAVFDHVIIGNTGKYFSFCDEGLI